MEYKGDEQPSLNDAGQPNSLEHSTVPASLLPSVLSRLGLGDMTGLSLTGVDNQLAALKDEEIPVRVAAVRSLGEHGETSTIGPLLAALHDSAWEVRAAAVWALGKFGEQAPLEALMKATDDEDGSVRAAALRTLELMGDRVTIEPLVRALGDSDWQVREIATLTLGDLGEQAPLEPLLARLNDEHSAVREAARIALKQSHPEALSTMSVDPIMITQESDSNSASGVREQEQGGPGVEVEARAKVPSNGDSTLIQLTTHVRTLLSRVVRDVVAPLADKRSTPADEEVSDVIVSEPGEMEAHPQPIQIKPRRFRHIAEGVLAALIIAGLVASWLIIQQRLHPSQGAASMPLLAYHGHADGPAVWSSDSKYVSFLADSTPAGETVLVWNRATGQVAKHMLHTLLAQSQEHQGVFAYDGKHLAFVERDSSSKVAVQVWDVVAWRSIFMTYYSSPNGYLAVYWSPDSTRIVIPAEDGTIQVWNVVTGHELATCHVPPLDYLPVNIYMSPDGHSVIFGFGPQNMYLLDLTTCKLLTLPSFDAVATFWSPQGNRFATVSLTDNSMVQIWDAHTGRNLASFHLSAPLSGLVWTPDGTRIVTLGDKEVDVLDVVTQRIVLKVVSTRNDLLPFTALSPDGGRIASLSGADTVQIWDAVTGQKLNFYQSPGNSVKIVAWSPDSRTIATGSTDGTVRVWYADRSPQTYHSDSSAVLNIAWSPDGKSIATGNVNGSMWVWKVN
jgi:HEAT repeat protein/WD40 repeat protein